MAILTCHRGSASLCRREIPLFIPAGAMLGIYTAAPRPENRLQVRYPSALVMQFIGRFI